MIDPDLIQARYLDFLKLKYHVTVYKEPGVEKLLCQILRNANIGLPITSADLGWLRKNHFYKTVEIIRLEQDLRYYHDQEPEEISNKLKELKKKYKIPDSLEPEIFDSVRLLLWQLEFQHTMTPRETQYLQDNGLHDLATLAQEMQSFNDLKLKYWVDYAKARTRGKTRTNTGCSLNSRWNISTWRRNCGCPSHSRSQVL